jgi:hypothetical protein
MIGDFLELSMLICFGISWPVAAIKAWKARTAKGNTVLLYYLLMVGYLLGIAAKIVNHQVTFVLGAYGFNFLMVGVNCVLYYRNHAFDLRVVSK